MEDNNVTNINDIEYNFWIDYYKGNIKRELTKEEREIIYNYNFVLHLMISDEDIINLCGSYERMLLINEMPIVIKEIILENLASKINQPKEIVELKIRHLIYVSKNEDKIPKSITKKKSKKIIDLNEYRKNKKD